MLSHLSSRVALESFVEGPNRGRAVGIGRAAEHHEIVGGVQHVAGGCIVAEDQSLAQILDSSRLAEGANGGGKGKVELVGDGVLALHVMADGLVDQMMAGNHVGMILGLEGGQREQLHLLSGKGRAGANHEQILAEIREGELQLLVVLEAGNRGLSSFISIKTRIELFILKTKTEP